MHSTLVSGWTVTNLGPLTTTYTAPAACSTDFVYVQVGQSMSFDNKNGTYVIPLGVACDQAELTVGSCLPSGAKLDEAYSSVDTNLANVGTTLNYYSPGLACPSGWDTAGVATKAEGGSITSSGPGFARPTDTDEDYVYIQNLGPNVLLAAMDDGDAAVLCCPSSFEVDAWGGCTSLVPTYSVPPEYCQRVLAQEDGGEYVNTTLSIWGTTVTGSAFSLTGTGTVTTETRTLETPVEDYVGVSIVAMLYLVNGVATETGATTGTSSPTLSAASSATSSSSSSSSSSPASASAASVNARGTQLASAALIASTLAIAFTSGFMLLMA